MVAKSTKIDGFDERGKFALGNAIGRMKKKGFTLTDLNKLVRKYEEATGDVLLKHYIGQLFKDNKLLEKYIERNVPTKQIGELTGKDGSPLSVTLVETVYDESDKKDAG